MLLRFIYSLAMFLALPLIILRLFWKSINFKPYRHRVLERLALYKNFTVAPNGFLIHAVSVGEVVLADPLIKALQSKYPTKSITLTTITPAGSQQVQKKYAKDLVHTYLPYDLPWMVNRFMNKIAPSCVIVMETEIWPNLINACTKRKIPIIIANGRLSDNSIKRYVWIRFFMAKVLRQLTFVTAQAKIDADRFLRLGLPQNKLQITGNLKFDVQINERLNKLGVELKNSLRGRLVLVAASTHAGEEELILDAYAKIKIKFPNLLLILIPRHPDRFAGVAELLQSRKINFMRRTEQIPCTEETEIILGDTMGEMGLFYAAADVAFVGGSLVPIGGHNVLEPAVVGLPIISGKHYENFKDITNLLIEAKALTIAQNVEDLANEIISLLESPAVRSKRGASALQVVLKNRGAIQKLLNIIQQNV